MVQYVGKYLRIHRFELEDNKIDTQAELEQSILCGNTTHANGTIKCCMGICLKTAKKLLNCLGYK